MQQEEQQNKEDKEELVKEEVVQDAQEEGRYIYCVVEKGNTSEFQEKGIENNSVYLLCDGDLCAVVHTCPAKPYVSPHKEQVIDWVKAHQKVIDQAYAVFGTVIPFSFDVIIKGSKGKHSEQLVKEWLRSKEEELKKKIERIKGKQEFGVKIFLHEQEVMKAIMQSNKEIQNLEDKIKIAKKGVAYFHKQKIQAIIKKEIEKYAELYFKEFYKKIKQAAEEVRVEKAKKQDTFIMVLNASVLVKKEHVSALGDMLDYIHKKQGFSVEFTGPWPPYSFTS
ncbi:GvpL/GvpF family gas vesicle protein [Candidatus Woesearchaeota archaeon]|nr:GvpL/GvpF family gas vesicle protein [Candidatus Woesearchaeota archaeon]